MDLGQKQRFNQIKIEWEYWADQYEIWVSNDNRTWKKAADQSMAKREKDIPQPRDAIYFASPVEARYVKIAKIAMNKRPAKTGAAAETSQWTPVL